MCSCRCVLFLYIVLVCHSFITLTEGQLTQVYLASTHSVSSSSFSPLVSGSGSSGSDSMMGSDSDSSSSSSSSSCVSGWCVRPGDHLPRYVVYLMVGGMAVGGSIMVRENRRLAALIIIWMGTYTHNTYIQHNTQHIRMLNNEYNSHDRFGVIHIRNEEGKGKRKGST